MNKILYIIPGYDSHAFNPIGDELAKCALKRGIIPVPVTIDWKKKKRRKASFKEYLKAFEKQINVSNYDKVYAFGFSFGAMIAFLAAAKLEPDVLILGSLSPWFKEDMASLTKSDLEWWKENYSGDRPAFDVVARRIKSKAYIFVGEKEFAELLHRAHEAHRLIKKSSLKIIPGVGHDISKKKYMDAVKSVINTL